MSQTFETRARRAWRAILAWLPALVMTLGLAAAGGAPSQPTAETPTAFAQRVITLYGPQGRWWKLPDTPAGEAERTRIQQAYLEADFNKLMEDNGAIAGQKAGGPDLDYDPVCQCQDGPEHIRLKGVVMKSPDLAELQVQGPDCSPKSNECDDYALVVARTPGGWRIHDVVEKAGSLRARLIRDNACMRAAKNETAAGKCFEAAP
jgi:hypothetical protein